MDVGSHRLLAVNACEISGAGPSVPAATVCIFSATGSQTPVAGALTVTAANIQIQGKVTSPGGTLKFTALNKSPFDPLETNPTPFPSDPERGAFDLGAAAACARRSVGSVIQWHAGHQRHTTMAVPE